MDFTQILLIGAGVLCGMLAIVLGVLFFVSRRSQRVMESLLQLMTQPDRARVADASRVLQTILADEIAKIESSFQTMRDTLNAQIASANELKQELTVQNEKLVTTADEATKKVALMSQRLDNTVLGLHNIVSSGGWTDVQNTTDNFSTTVNALLTQIDTTSTATAEQIATIQSQIDGWVATSETLGQNLKDAYNTNDEQMKNLSQQSDNLQQQLQTLAQSVTDGFNNVKTAAADYETVMTNNDKLLNDHLTKMDTFSKQSKKQLTSQMNSLTNTSNAVGGQVRLAEASIEKQTNKLTAAVETLMDSAARTETSVRGISNELATLTNRFNGEIKEFATAVVSELKTVSGVANTTLENTKTSANAFSESVKAMATGVRETLIEMNTAHTQLSGQSANLIKMSAETTAQLQPLSELIERYYSALPDLSQGSVEAGEKLQQIVASLNEKIGLMKSTVAESTDTISASAIKLEDLAGQSRQQMIDLMSDYAKAVNTMQTLNKQMMVARATAPMDAMGVAPAPSYGRVSATDFLKQAERAFENMHDLSLDLTRATGAEIPDVVWKKYHAGDKAIFSKWLAKMMNAADKKQVREMLKNDTVFRRQATQFIRAFDKIMSGAHNVDNPDAVSATLLKTDLGQIYAVLKAHI
ncbi:MAG TPA: hypothetical protein DD611_02190 [Alphaproteobacteria bacterium]|nr:hypothetical protein [Alphaproteobacteria bacterium]